MRTLNGLLGAVVILMAAGTACVTPRYKINIVVPGDVDGDQSTAAEHSAKDLDWDRVYPVKVVTGKPPQGLEVKEENGQMPQLVVLHGFENRYKVLGSVMSVEDSSTRILAGNFLWYNNAHEKYGSFIDVYCKAQLPFRMITYGIWTLVPLSYPCFFGYPGDRSESLRLHTQELKRAVYALGGNLLVSTSKSTGYAVLDSQEAPVPKAR